MDDPGSPLALILVFALVLVNAFFAMSEIAFISLNDNKLRKESEEGNKKARVITKLLDEPNNFLATIQVAITLSGLLSSAIAADTYADPAAEFLAKFIPIDPDIVHGATVFVLTIVLSYISLVLGELVPKRIAMKNAEKLALGLSFRASHALTKRYLLFLFHK